MFSGIFTERVQFFVTSCFLPSSTKPFPKDLLSKDVNPHLEEK